jgi:hypothetical protein
VVRGDGSAEGRVTGELVRLLVAAPADRVILAVRGAHDAEGDPVSEAHPRREEVVHESAGGDSGA